MDQKTRQHETTIEIPAPVEQVWQAITTAAGVQAWCAPTARIDPRPGGEYFVSWGEGMDGPGTIEVCEPPSHLRVVVERDTAGGGEQPDAKAEAARTRIAMDYYLESREAATVLRLVHSGFLASADWDREFEGTRKGWPIMLRILRYSLVEHRDVPGRQAWFYMARKAPMEDAWKAVAEALKENAVVYSAPPDEYCATWNAMGDGLVYLAFGSLGGPIGISANVVLYGDAIGRLPEAAEYWQKELDRILAPVSASTGA